MRKPNLNQSALTRYCNMFWLNLRWLDSTHIALALQDNQEDSQRQSMEQPLLWESITPPELLTYHRQIFMWRLRISQRDDQTLLSN